MNLKPQIYQFKSTDNNYYIQREDLLPFSFGGNKLRKNLSYFEEILSKDFSHVVTYGSKSSNHARIVANFCAKYSIKCTIITPEDNNGTTFNSTINDMLNTQVIYTPLNSVNNTIEKTLEDLKQAGEKPYFIQGGGHGFKGTKAYVDAFKHIVDFSNEYKTKFDYIFLASGTGATQAGIIIGNYLNDYTSKVIGISVGRKKSIGTSIIKQSIEEYLRIENISQNLNLDVIFTDDFLSGGYGQYNDEIVNCIKDYMRLYGIPLDPTYTGKAIYGMNEYIINNDIKNKNILYIHTGGTPLYFNHLKEEFDA